MDENLNRAFPHQSSEERQALIWKNYQHYGILFCEFLRSFYRQEVFLRQNIKAEGVEHLCSARDGGKGIFVMTAHLGNWEALTAHGAAIMQMPVTMVTKQLKPLWLHEYIARVRARSLVKMAFEPKTMPTILRSLKENGIVGFVMDQHAGAPVGARVPFFGVPAGSHTALAMLALRMDIPVVPAITYRLPDGKYCSRFEAPVEILRTGHTEQDILLNTARFVAITERWVREFPEQWLWIHRRWKGDLSPLKPGEVGELLK